MSTKNVGKSGDHLTVTGFTSADFIGPKAKRYYALCDSYGAQDCMMRVVASIELPWLPTVKYVERSIDFSIGLGGAIRLHLKL